MQSAQDQGSEVTRLLKQISEEYASAKLGLVGLAYGTSQHKIITQKMENIGKWHEELKVLVGEDAIALIVEVMEAVPDVQRPSAQ